VQPGKGKIEHKEPGNMVLRLGNMAQQDSKVLQPGSMELPSVQHNTVQQGLGNKIEIDIRKMLN
jgi:hypothetical protein